jgi:hypothetical protein
MVARVCVASWFATSLLAGGESRAEGRGDRDDRADEREVLTAVAKPDNLSGLSTNRSARSGKCTAIKSAGATVFDRRAPRRLLGGRLGCWLCGKTILMLGRSVRPQRQLGLFCQNRAIFNIMMSRFWLIANVDLGYRVPCRVHLY